MLRKIKNYFKNKKTLKYMFVLKIKTKKFSKPKAWPLSLLAFCTKFVVKRVRM